MARRLVYSSQVDEETIMALFIKTPKNIFSYGVLLCILVIQCHLISEALKLVFQYRRSRNEVGLHLIEKLAT